MALALYRKYRPGSFAEVKGQGHVTGPLQQALRNGRIHHAYLFSGPRGCGKTSSARILARSLNCEQGPTPDPCGVCDSCVALAPNGPGSLDVVEIDAASHGGVDDARDLRERAFYAPISSRYKVYIIDEAHMVSQQGFNALLKLVEEPPDYLRFVFATTEPEKVLQTIRSRTHHYPFRLMPRTELTRLLEEVVAAEGIAVDPAVLPLVVRAAAGSARDGLSILDQVMASAGADGVTREAAAGLLGVTPDTLLDDVVDAFAAGDGAAVFATVDEVMEGGHDPRRFAQDVLERLRDLVVLDAVPDAGAKGLLDCPQEELDRMSRQAAALGSAGLSRAADLFHAGLTEMRGTTAPRLLLELVCARVLLPAASSDDAAVISRVERLERRLEIAGPPAAAPPSTSASRTPPAPPAPRPEHALDLAPTPVPAPAPTRAPDPVPARPRQSAPAGSTLPAASRPQGPPAGSWPTTAALGAPAPPAGPDAADPAAGPTSAPLPAGSDPAAVGGLDAVALRRSWDAVLGHVKAVKKTAWMQLDNAQVVSVEGHTLTLSFAHAGTMRAFQSGASPDFARDALKEVLGVDLQITCVAGDAPAAAPARPGAAPRSAGPPTGAPTASLAAPAYDGFAPGDEAEPEDPDAPPPPERVHSEDAALSLVQSELGGRVMKTIGEQ